MKFWNNPFKEEHMQKCICGIENERMKATLGLAQRRWMLFFLGNVTLTLLFIFYGPWETIGRFWWAIALTVVLVVALFISFIGRITRHHSAKCSIRYAFLRVF